MTLDRTADKNGKVCFMQAMMVLRLLGSELNPIQEAVRTHLWKGMRLEIYFKKMKLKAVWRIDNSSEPKAR